eukprot:CAMPEP_0114237558 /NCGR_PEP_ID=MMETSP0058-20121206/7456_1 /TAXON_ID=36894 /ORGANISM="Pyramimonas parkeae, CCMP726" /LENGTH=410 /DNA_ID=CAMNT_0001349611 /DNA_START=52 /DNA_END=1284 /DNA_ORIENTATION=+
MAGPTYVEDSSSEEDTENTAEHHSAMDAGPVGTANSQNDEYPQGSAKPVPSASSLSSTSNAQTVTQSSASADAGRIASLTKELEEARKAQRSLAAKLVQGGSGQASTSSADSDAGAQLSIARTISGLEEELETLRRNLEFKNFQVAAVAQEMARMHMEMEKARCKAAELEAVKDAMTKQTEEEVERLQEELSEALARTTAEAAHKRSEGEERRAREAAAVQEAKEAAANEWREKMQAIERQYQGKLSEKEKEMEALSFKSRDSLKSPTQEGNWGDKYADATMQAGQVKAEFDSFKAMTRRVMQQKDEELKRLMQLEEGIRSRAHEVTTTISQATKDNRILEAVKDQLVGAHENHKGRLFALGIILCICGMTAMLYQTYKRAGSLICFLDIIGLQIGAGCAGAVKTAKSLR